MKRLSRLWQQGKEFLGVEIPIMAGAMTWISDHRLVSTVGNHGAIGCMTGGTTPCICCRNR